MNAMESIQCRGRPLTEQKQRNVATTTGHSHRTENRALHCSESSSERVCAVHVVQKYRRSSLNQILQLRRLRRPHRGDQIVERRSRATLHSVQKYAIDVAPARCYFILL